MRDREFTEKLEDYRTRQFDRVEEISLEDLNISLYEAKALGFSKPEEMIRWHLNSKMSMSSRHLKGRFLEDLIESIAEDLLDDDKFSETKEWDIAIERDDKVYLVDIKYSLNPISLRHLRSSNEREFQERLGKDVKWVLGTPRKIEGNKEKVKDKFEGDKIVQGTEFWNFIANEERALSKITETLYESNRDGENISDVIEEKSEELAEEWKIRFGEEVINDETVERFF